MHARQPSPSAPPTLVSLFALTYLSLPSTIQFSFNNPILVPFFLIYPSPPCLSSAPVAAACCAAWAAAHSSESWSTCPCSAAIVALASSSSSSLLRPADAPTAVAPASPAGGSRQALSTRDLMRSSLSAISFSALGDHKVSPLPLVPSFPSLPPSPSLRVAPAKPQTHRDQQSRLARTRHGAQG